MTAHVFPLQWMLPAGARFPADQPAQGAPAAAPAPAANPPAAHQQRRRGRPWYNQPTGPPEQLELGATAALCICCLSKQRRHCYHTCCQRPALRAGKAAAGNLRRLQLAMAGDARQCRYGSICIAWQQCPPHYNMWRWHAGRRAAPVICHADAAHPVSAAGHCDGADTRHWAGTAAAPGRGCRGGGGSQHTRPGHARAWP